MGSRVLQPLTGTLTSSQSTFRFGRFHFSWKLSGEMFCRDTCHPEKAIFSFNSSAFPRKAKIHPQPPTACNNNPGQSKPKPVVTPQAKANLSPRTGVVRHGRGLSAGGEDGSWPSMLQVFRQPCDFRALSPGARGDWHVETALGSAQACGDLRHSLKTTPQLWFLKTRFPVAFRKISWQAALGLS